MNVIYSFLTINLLISLGIFSVNAYALEGEMYSQTVYLHKFKNPINQTKLQLNKKYSNFDLYGGLWLDHDKKTNATEGFTDAQIAPLVGIRSFVFGPDWLLSRVFFESRFVHRTKSFTDERIKNTYEARGGIMAYGLKQFNNPIFLETYYSAFFTRLYGEKFIVQGWTRQGLRYFNFFDVFNEIFVDSFDQTRDTDGTLDLRPGIRLFHQFQHGSVQLLNQHIYHFSNTAYAGRSEFRTTLVFGFYW